MANQSKKSQNSAEKINLLSEIYQKNDEGFKRRPSLRQALYNLSRNNNALISAIIFLGIISLLLGFFSIKNTVSAPYKNPYAEKIAKNSAQKTEINEDLLALRKKDTDFDGLSNYEEVNIYRTSPYLKDSDSDGISDYDEVKAGADPNCPTGQDCFNLKSDFSNEAAITSTVGAGSNPTAFSPDQIKPEDLRKLLKEAGMTEAEIEQLDDQTLLEAYQQSFAAASQGKAGDLPATLGSSGNELLDSISKLSPPEIRELLKSQGISEDILANVSDEELMGLVEESLSGG